MTMSDLVCKEFFISVEMLLRLNASECSDANKETGKGDEGKYEWNGGRSSYVHNMFLRCYESQSRVFMLENMK